MMSSLRTALRKAGLVNLVTPLVSLAEHWRLARICNYRVEEQPAGQVAFVFDSCRVCLIVSTPSFKQMAYSRHERPTTTVFLKHIQSGDIVCDVGANVGYYTCLLSILTGGNGNIFAFEPNPEKFRKLSKNIAESKCLNVTPIRTALADFEGEAQMKNADKVTSESRLVSAGSAVGNAENVVPVTTGDALLKGRKVTMPDFIKVDVEGFEHEVLRGMEKVLRQPRWRGLLCEIHFALLADRGKSNADKEIVALLRDAGFNDIRWVSRSHLLALKQ